VAVEPTELTGEYDTQVFGQLIPSTEQLAATYTDAQLAVIRDILERNRMAMAAHGNTLQREGSKEAT